MGNASSTPPLHAPLRQVAALLSPLCLLACAGEAATDSTTPAFDPADAVRHANWNGVAIPLRPADDFDGPWLTVEPNPVERRLDLSWMLPEVASCTQELELAFVPTAVTGGDVEDGRYELFVAGTTPRGVTKIRSVVLTSGPLETVADRSVLRPGQVVEERDVFESAPRARLHLVDHLVRNRGTDGRLFARFRSTMELVEIGARSPSRRVVAASEALDGSRALIVPALAADLDWLYGREHASDGYLYFLVDRDAPAVSVLRDLDRNGSLDDRIVIERAAWGSHTYSYERTFVGPPD